MGVNGQKLNFQAIDGRWLDNGVGTAWNSFLSVYNIATAFSDKIFVINAEVWSCGCPLAGANGGKRPKMEFSSKWGEMARQWGRNSLE